MAITPPAVRFEAHPHADRFDILANTPEGRVVFEGFPNDAGFLAKFQCTIVGLRFSDALFKAIRIVVPALSNISAQLDTPLEIRQTDVVEVRTGAVQTRIVTTPDAVALAIPPNLAPSDEYRAYASLYREGMNSTSMRYQFLCYYKIIDGIYARRRRLAVPVARVPERMPQTPEDRERWLKAVFPSPGELDEFVLDNTFPVESLGKKAANIVEKYLQPIRVR